MVLGTAGYMAPEQVRGLPADERADLFALGAILFEMLTGHRAFDRDSQDRDAQRDPEDDPPPLDQPQRRVPVVVERIVQRCLEKDPDARFQSARDLAFALDNSLGTGTGSTTADAAASGCAPSVVAAARWRSGLPLAAATIAALTAWTLKPAPSRTAMPVTRQLARFAIQPPPRVTFPERP